SRSARVLILDDDEALLPPLWQAGGLFADALSVVAERLVEGGQLADAAVDDLGALGMVQGEEIRLDRKAHGLRGIRKLTQDRLAADDHDRVIGGNDRGGADEVLELLPVHGVCEKRSRVSRQIFQRSRG